MRRFDVQSIELAVAAGAAFKFIANPNELPNWTNAFAQIDGQRARLRTPEGEVRIRLRVAADEAARTVDWFMTFPDGSTADAYSRLVPLASDRCVYTFTLTPPPVPLEALEGAIEAQSEILEEELARLKRLLEAGGSA